MMKPYFRTKNNGVPILSKDEINSIAEGFVQDFQESALTSPEEFVQMSSTFLHDLVSKT